MRVGAIVPMEVSDGPGREPTWPEMLGFVRHAEEIGLDSAWVCDHLWAGWDDKPPENVHEAWTLLPALAASTSRIELGQLVTCISFRDPSLLAKMAVTVDEISSGRILLGLGAGWYDAEYRAFGFPNDHRVDRFEEALQIIKPLLAGERVTFEGTYHAVDGARLMPSPSRPIPTLIAGERPRMLGLTARHANAWNTAWYAGPDDRLRAQFAAMDEALKVEGRDPATLRRTVGVAVRDPDASDDRGSDEAPVFFGSVDEMAALFDAYEELGADDVILELGPKTERSLDRVAEAIGRRG
jgi:alkanesulfonate monooxygenase SsuD/methylene tetrahydromethanopterin reductase-like flavin-dependent oxidoreductase (luciferase family)